MAVANHLNYVGVLCVEYFVVDNGAGGSDLIVNEMAPRPHNSGHYTQNACDMSQFEAQVRALAGLPLNTPRQHSPSLMVNLLGDLWFDRQWRARAGQRTAGVAALGPRCWPCRAPICTCTAKPVPARAARWAT